MKITTSDMDFSAAMLSKGARLDPDRPWIVDGAGPAAIYRFCLLDVKEEAAQAFRSGTDGLAQAFASRRFLLQVVKSAALGG